MASQGKSGYNYVEHLYQKMGFSKILSLRILAEDPRIEECCTETRNTGKIQPGSSKIMIMGDHGVGKTSTKKHLMGEKFDVDEPITKGVEEYNVETVKVDKKWEKINSGINEHKRAFHACVAAKYQNSDADGKQSNFQAASAIQGNSIPSIIILLLLGGLQTGLAPLQTLYLLGFCYLYKDLSYNHGYKFGQVFSVGFLCLDILSTNLNLLSDNPVDNPFKCIFVMICGGFAVGALTGGGCRHGLALAFALLIRKNQIFLYTIFSTKIWEVYNFKRLFYLICLQIGIKVGSILYQKFEYQRHILKKLIFYASIIGFFAMAFYCKCPVFSYTLKLNSTHQNISDTVPSIILRIISGATFTSFFWIGKMYFGRPLLKHTVNVNHFIRLPLGFFIWLAIGHWFLGVEICPQCSLPIILDTIIGLAPTLTFEILGYLHVKQYEDTVDLREICKSLKRGERSEEIIPLYFHIVDFAGHKEYHTSHQAFMVRDAVYLVVFKLDEAIQNKEKVFNSILYWLASIHLQLGYNQSVFLVGTHRDKIKDNQELENFRNWLSEQITHTEYGNLINLSYTGKGPTRNSSKICYAIDNSKHLCFDTEARALRQKVSEYIKDKYMNKEIPVAWFCFPETIKTLSSQNNCHFMKRKELYQHFNEELKQEQFATLDDNNFIMLLRFFNDRGDIRYEESLPDIVVLNTKIFRDAIVALTTKANILHQDASLLNTKGIVSKEVIISALSVTDEEERNILLILLEVNGLIQPLVSSHGINDYLLYGFLPEYDDNLQNPRMTTKDQCVFYFDFKGVWPGKIFLKLIVKCFEHSVDNAMCRDSNTMPLIYKNAGSFFHEVDRTPYSIRLLSNSPAQHLIQICIPEWVSNDKVYTFLECMNDWIQEMTKPFGMEYILGPECTMSEKCVYNNSDGKVHKHLYRLADHCSFEHGRDIQLICPCHPNYTITVTIVTIKPQASGLDSSFSASRPTLITDEFLNEIAKGMGAEYIHVGAYLKLPYNEINLYEHEYSTSKVFRSSRKVLDEWLQRNADRPERELLKDLAESLQKCQKMHLAVFVETHLN